MKAHIPASTRLTRKEKAVVREYDEQVRNEEYNRYLKICAVALHEKFGFGHDRIADFLGELTKLAGEAEKDEVFWKHVDDVVLDELKFTDWKRENYGKVDR